jgi:hypothetical protein
MVLSRLQACLSVYYITTLSTAMPCSVEGHDRMIMNAELRAVEAYFNVLSSHLSVADSAANKSETP